MFGLMATIKDIANASNVSIASVSRVINNTGSVAPKTREKILKSVAELGYRPNANARALKSNQANSLGLVIADWHGAFFSCLAKGVESVARKRDATLLVSTGAWQAETELKAIELLLEQRCQSLVVHSKFLSDDVLVDLSKEAPMVFINRFIPQVPQQCIWLDNKIGGVMMTRYILSKGHRNLVFINSNQHIEDSIDREAGIKTELAKQGLTFDPERTVYVNPNYDGGEAAIQQFIAKGIEFSAVIAYNDAVACGAMSSLQDFGVDVPKDVSVIGFDDTDIAKYSRPKLTTLNYPITEMAEVAANLVLDMVQAKENIKPYNLSYVPSLTIRQSVIGSSK